MAMVMYDWIYGISQIAAVVLSCIAGLIALYIFKDARKQELLGAWKPMCAALALFAVEELLGLFRTFDVYGTAAFSWVPAGMVRFLTTAATHILPFFILMLLIAALIKQINIKRGWVA